MRKNIVIVKRPRHRKSRIRRRSIRRGQLNHHRRVIRNHRESITLFDFVLNPIEYILVLTIIIVIIHITFIC